MSSPVTFSQNKPEHAIIPLWLRDSRGEITYVGDLCWEGAFPEDGTESFLERVHPDDRDHTRVHLQTLQRGDELSEATYRVRLDSDAYRWVVERNLSASPPGEEAGRYVSIAFDVTSQKEMAESLYESKKQFRDLVEGSIQGLLIHKDWKILFANQALADMFGHEGPEELLALESLALLIHPDEHERIWGYKTAREQGNYAPESYELQCLRKDGSLLWAEFRAKQVEWCGTAAIQCAVVDVTDRKQAEKALRLQNQALCEQIERFNIALENMSQGLCMFDTSEKLLVCNDRYIDLYNLPRDLAEPGTPFREIVEHRIKTGVYAGEDAQSYIEERLAAVHEGEASTKLQELTDGRVIAIAHRPMANGGWVATHEDITELQQVQNQIAHMAHHDALTDLPNRVLLRQRLENALPLAHRGTGFAVLCLDLDRFKSVNDTLGHPIGDDLLMAVAERLHACVRETDTISRLGGDEFAILQLSDNQPQDATALASRICEMIKKPLELRGHQVVIDTSIGIAIAPDDGLDADQLIKNADMALYRAKSDGRGSYRFFEAEMDALMQARRSLELDLRKALEQGDFELHYQPLVNLETNGLSGFEALLRWQHRERGMVPPSEFIPLAEEIGLIIPLGEWVIRTACKQAASWPSDMKISVNLSPAQFRNDNLVPTVFNALAVAGISPRRLELEITEAVLLNETTKTVETLHQLRKMGVRIAMDDFGTGYSSLSYLRKFPFDRIKIDGSFVSDLSEQEGTNAIIDAVASLSRSLGMATTAEGVETPEQLALVRAAGYTEMQGFLFSPPRSAEEITRLYFSPAEQTEQSA